MSARRAPRRLPIYTFGSVNLLAPTGSSKYYRLTWTQPDGRPGGTTAGIDLKEAKDKVHEIAAWLQLASGPSGSMTLQEVVDEYLGSPIGRKRSKNGGDWTTTYLDQQRRILERATHGHRDVRCWDVDRKLLDTMRAQAGTGRTVSENTKALRGLLHWGHAEGYFSAEQAELLPVRCPPIKPSRKGTAAPSRRRRARRAEEPAFFISDEDAPSAAQVRRLCSSLAIEFPSWGALAPEFAANTGLRWGEQFQLTAYDCYVEEDDFRRAGHVRPFIAVDWQVDKSARVTLGQSRRKLPKGEKVRTAGLPQVSFTGYRLLDAVRERRAEALREQANGTNPEALMFPTKTGKIFHHPAFNTKYLVPAALRCNTGNNAWPTRTWTETYEKRCRRTDTYSPATRQRTQMIMTWHSLRHRFARICVDILGMKAAQLMALGGWDDETVVMTRYYKSGREHVESGLECFDRMS